MTDSTYYMGPQEIAGYDTRRRMAEFQASRQFANLARQRERAGEEYNLGLPRIRREWDKAFRGLPGQFARRGILRSGQFKTANEDFGIASSEAISDWMRRYQNQLSDFSAQEEDIRLARQMALGEIEAQQNARRAQLAADIRARL